MSHAIRSSALSSLPTWGTFRRWTKCLARLVKIGHHFCTKIFWILTSEYGFLFIFYLTNVKDPVKITGSVVFCMLITLLNTLLITMQNVFASFILIH